MTLWVQVPNIIPGVQVLSNPFKWSNVEREVASGSKEYDQKGGTEEAIAAEAGSAMPGIFGGFMAKAWELCQELGKFM